MSYDAVETLREMATQLEKERATVRAIFDKIIQLNERMNNYLSDEELRKEISQSMGCIIEMINGDID